MDVERSNHRDGHVGGAGARTKERDSHDHRPRAQLVVGNRVAACRGIAGSRHRTWGHGAARNGRDDARPAVPGSGHERRRRGSARRDGQLPGDHGWRESVQRRRRRTVRASLRRRLRSAPLPALMSSVPLSPAREPADRNPRRSRRPPRREGQRASQRSRATHRAVRADNRWPPHWLFASRIPMAIRLAAPA